MLAIGLAVKRHLEEQHAGPLPPSREKLSAPLAGAERLQRYAGNRAVVGVLRQPRPAPPAPKTDEQQWEDDWNDPVYARKHHYFEGTDRPAGTAKQRYDVLCPLYRDQGIKRPLKFVAEEIVDSDFFGHATPMHADLKTALKAAEATLNQAGVTTAPFRKCWAFNPRTQSGGQWSNHADGKAIDIDEDSNPRLLDKGNRAVISALTDMDISAANPGAAQRLDSYDAGREASSRFQARYNAGGLAERVEELAGEELELDEERQEIADALGLIPTGKGTSPKPTADQKKDAAKLTTRLKAKQAEIKTAVAARKTLEKEYTRFVAIDKAVDDLEKAIATLQTEIDALHSEIDALEKTPASAARDNAVKSKKTALAAKATAIKRKQAQLVKATKTRDDDTLRGYATRGFLDLNKPMVQALTGAGLRWGGDYAGAKDFMHFEVVH